MKVPRGERLEVLREPFVGRDAKHLLGELGPAPRAAASFAGPAGAGDTFRNSVFTELLHRPFSPSCPCPARAAASPADIFSVVTVLPRARGAAPQGQLRPIQGDLIFR